MARLKFPRTGTDEYEGTIRFEPIERVEIDPKSLPKLFKIFGNANEDRTRANEFPSAAGSLQEETAFLTEFGKNVTAAGGKRILNQIGVNQFSSSFYGDNLSPTRKGRKLKLTGNSCTLYLPTRINVSDGVNYGSLDLNAGKLGRGAMAQNAFESSGGNIAATAAQFITQTGAAAGAAIGIPTAAISDPNSLQGLGKSGAAFLANKLARSKLTGAGARRASLADKILGIKVNPNQVSNFEGVNVRGFQFSFKMIPATEAEAREIGEIIKFFRRELYPESVGIDAVSLAYRYPRKFMITLAYRDQEVATKILPSYLKDFSTDYNPNSMSFHYRNGNAYFPEINISMSFLEERALTAQDVEFGGY